MIPAKNDKERIAIRKHIEKKGMLWGWGWGGDKQCKGEP